MKDISPIQKIKKNKKKLVTYFSITTLVVSLIAISILNVGLIEFATAGASTSDFSNYLNLTIDATQVSGTHTDFAVLVYNSSISVLDGLDNNDFTFFDDSGEEMDWELVEWDDASDTLEAWVRTNITAGTDYFYLYYEDVADTGDTDGGEHNPTDVWDTYYKLVLHMNGSQATEVVDSTSYANDVTGDDSTTPVYQEAGQVGDCIAFDGIAGDSGDNLVIAHDPTLSMGNAVNDDNFTIECWLNCDSITHDTGTPFSKYGSDAEYQIQLTNTVTRIYLVDDSASSGQSAGCGAFPLNCWVYATFRYGGVGGNDAWKDQQIFFNGTAQTMSMETDGVGYVAMETKSGILPHIGCRHDSKNYYDGHIDELHISKANRTASWILTKYNMMNNKTSFYTWAGEDASEEISTCVLVLHGNPAGNYTFTLQGMAGNTVYANDTGSYYETGEFNFTINGTDYFERVTLNVSDITDTIIDGNDIYVTFDDDNSSWSGNWHQCTNGGESIVINGTNWDANNWMGGTNPFTADGDADGEKEIQTNSSFWFLIRIDIPVDATTVTHSNFAMSWDAGRYE